MAGRRSATFLFFYAQWPSFLLGYTIIVAALVMIGWSAGRDWWALVLIMTALLLAASYYFLAGLWLVNQLGSRRGLAPHHALFDLGHLQATDTLVYLDLGRRYRPIELAGRLTTGQAIVVDVYAPQLTPKQSLARWRRRLPNLPDDPRLVWRAGTIDLLPLPDRKYSTVVICQVLSEFGQQGDQLKLLREARRILVPNGRLLLAERTRTPAAWVTMGPLALTLQPSAHWEKLLESAGFVIRAQKDLDGLIHCFRAERPSAVEGRQLQLDLAI